MPPKPDRNKPQTSQRHLVYAALAFVSVATLGGQAHAGCAGPIAKDAAATTLSIGKSITSAGLLITQAFIELNDSLTRYANQISNDDQNMVKTQQSLSDRVSAQDNAGTVGQARASVASQFIPSRVVCGIVSQQERVNSSYAQYATYRTQMQTANTSFSNNGPGSGSERGTIQALNTGFNHRCGRYVNASTMDPGGSVLSAISCPAAADATMKDLDIQPWKAILDPIMFTTAARKTAAEDAIKMLTELAPPDPIRGNVLLRSEGQNLHVMRMRDVTRMNLARGVLEDIVALRSSTGGAKSRLATYIELITGQEYNPATNSLSGQLQVIMSAKEPQNASIQVVSARLATQQSLIFELLRLGEQITMLDATALAIKVERSRSGGASVSARPISN